MKKILLALMVLASMCVAQAAETKLFKERKAEGRVYAGVAMHAPLSASGLDMYYAGYRQDYKYSFFKDSSVTSDKKGIVETVTLQTANNEPVNEKMKNEILQSLTKYKLLRSIPSKRATDEYNQYGKIQKQEREIITNQYAIKNGDFINAVIEDSIWYRTTRPNEKYFNITITYLGKEYYAKAIKEMQKEKEEKAAKEAKKKQNTKDTVNAL